MKLHKSENKRKAEWIEELTKDYLDKEVIISCNGEERKGMSTMAMNMDKYIKK